VRRQIEEDEDVRVSIAELFFDLVFVLAVTQLSALLVHDLTAAGAARTLFLLLVAWWAWIYTTWTTNWFDADTREVRLVLLAGMLASMFGAISIPDAFGDRAWLLVAGYVGIQSLRNVFAVLHASRDDSLYLPLVRILIWSSWVSGIWVAGAFVDEDTRVALWLVALAADYAGPAVGHWAPGLGRTAPSEWELIPSHFSERIQLFVIIALGESIVAAGVTASGLEITAERMFAVTTAFAITSVLWWLYFDYHAEHVLEVLSQRKHERGRLARDLSYIHIPLIAGIIIVAVANELVIAHPGETLHGMELATLAAGPILYLLGSLAFKMRVVQARAVDRLAASGLIGGVTLLGTTVSAIAIWTLVFAILTALALLESAQRRAGANRSADA
jgi:low temperature requirement protein LtrA